MSHAEHTIHCCPQQKSERNDADESDQSVGHLPRKPLERFGIVEGADEAGGAMVQNSDQH